MYQFIVIDPRKPVVPPNTLGIEVTVSEIAAMCDLGNIDEQHSAPSGGRAAIEVAWGKDVGGGPEINPPHGATLATVRPDLDALGAMAVLALRRSGAWGLLAPAGDSVFRAITRRVRAIAAADGNTATTWEPRPLPTAENPWPRGVAVDSNRDLAAIAAVCALHNTAVAYRVALVAAWLLGGDTPTPEQVHTACMAVLPSLSAAPFDIIDTLAECRARVESERADMIAALSDGRIQVSTSVTKLLVDPVTLAPLPQQPGAIAIVRSAHRAATSVGYAHAPLAICFHPAFPWPQGHTTPKATIAWAVPPGAETVQRVRDALNAAEREKIATQIDSIDLGVTYEGDFPGVFFDARPGRPAVGAATLLRGGHISEALDVIADIASADAERFAKDVAVITAAIKSEWGGNLASGILGSPQGRASLLTEDEIVSIVRGAL